MGAWTWADQSKEVHVYQQTSAGGVTTQLSDQPLMTGSQYSTVTAPKLDGYVFTHWSISRTQTFTNRDRLGRACDFVTFDLYEATTLTANYLPASQDDDGDGVADVFTRLWSDAVYILDVCIDHVDRRIDVATALFAARCRNCAQRQGRRLYRDCAIAVVPDEIHRRIVCRLFHGALYHSPLPI